jgi:sec-independent protein translocase protein TatA
MPSLGPAEILVILVVALLVFGPNKMPEIARQVGRGMRELRRVQQHLSSELHDVVAEFGPDDAPPPGGDAPTVLQPPVPPVAATPPPASMGPPPASPSPAESPRPATSAPASAADDAEARGRRVWPPRPDPTA